MNQEATIASVYDSLARLIGKRHGKSAPPVRKRLLAPDGGKEPDARALDPWILQKAAPTGADRVLDLGCGFGATSFLLVRGGAASSVGLTLSPLQAEGASAHAAENGLRDRCEFRVASFDDGLPPGRFQIVVAVESLVHSRDLQRLYENLRSVATPDTRVVVVEDMATDDLRPDDSDLVDLCRRWGVETWWTRQDHQRAWERAGFSVVEEEDFTSLVVIPKQGQTMRRRILRVAERLPGRRALISTFLGGVLLEQLYGRGLMEYRGLVLRRGTAAR